MREELVGLGLRDGVAGGLRGAQARECSAAIGAGSRIEVASLISGTVASGSAGRSSRARAYSAIAPAASS